jgi:cob(I)alamin adenosyltransferase
MINRGMVHIYTGNGKGKSTAAFGMAIRALGHNKKVYIAQFMKAMKYGEVLFLENQENITIKQFGNSKHLLSVDEIDQEHLDAFNKGYKEVLSIIEQNIHEMIILDEILVSHFFKLVTTEQIIHLIKKNKQNKSEMILTGRYAPKELYNVVDLVSEIKEIKHYYNEYKLEPRIGIES